MRTEESNEKELLVIDEQLRKFCDEIEHRFKFVPPPFWTAEIYGFGLQISGYGYYPYFLPLCVYTDHGPGYYNNIPEHEIQSGAPVQLYHSPISVRQWNKVSTKEAHCLYSPVVFYRKQRKIERNINATGTIAFPAHSTPSIDDVGGYGKYIGNLKTLSEKYYPITICLHMHDIKKGLHLDFLRNGFKVVTAGNTSDQRFIARFYEIIARHKYATSNIPGSYLYYCVELGLPFFIYGEKPNYINKSDPNLAVGPYDPFAWGYGKEVYDLFRLDDPNATEPQIADRQREFVDRHLGLKDGISRGRMALVLYGTLAKYLLTGKGILYVLKNNIFLRALNKVSSFIWLRF
jgi:hypothetical protein